MTRSAEFDATVRYGVRAAQPDLVVHARRLADCPGGPRIGFVVGRRVGSAVDRHRVARRLRHAARTVVGELKAGDRVVVRALPGSRHAESSRLQQELAAGVRRAHQLIGRRR
jgi:ribonuclease P protein component